MLETLIVDGTSTAAGAAEIAESLTSRNSKDVDNSKKIGNSRVDSSARDNCNMR